uniref:Endonuclease/exonuclease/phosphatase domain-containing protein n=1 Tax=Hordeum vulgare subsp. vulgare TaxID=112509 RepID=A0A8I6X7B7_HORVV
MNLLFWNSRWVGNRRTVREVLALAKANYPKLVFLSETRQASNKIEKLKWRLGLKGFHGVCSDGQSGGLALFWDKSLRVSIRDSCSRHIDVDVMDGNIGSSWRATFFYGEPRVENRHLMWQHLSRLCASSLDPWLVCGNFNEALWQHEHLSRTQRAEVQIVAFRDCLTVCQLEDLGFSCMPYTYDNGQHGDRNVRVHLDRACADE